MSNTSVAVGVTTRERAILERLSRARLSPQRLVERCRIVLLSTQGRNNEDQAAELGVDRQRVRRWRHRWFGAREKLAAAEQKGVTDKELEALIVELLDDNERSGAPPTFTAEQMAGIIGLACEPPGDSGLPVSHWTPPELAREAIKRKIVESISPRQVDRFLARRTCDRTKASTG